MATTNGSNDGFRTDHMNSTKDEFLSLIASPFDSKIYSASFLSALAFYGLTTLLVLFAFCVIRPHRRDVYEPRVTQPVDRPAPSTPPQGPLGWLRTADGTDETNLMKQIGLDAVVFLRFTRMIRNIFAVLTPIACGTLIPANVRTAVASSARGIFDFSRLTPLYSGKSPVFWTYVGTAYLVDLVVCLFLWSNYRKIARLKRAHFQSIEYQSALHARTLLLLDIPSPSRSDQGVCELTGAGPDSAIGRDVGDLKRLVKQHDRQIDELNEDPSSDCTTHAGGLRELKRDIRSLRRSPEKLKPMSYGFATYPTVAAAHLKAYQYGDAGPEGTHVRLAEEPVNFVWRNLSLSRKDRMWRKRVNNVYVASLTVAWLILNVFIAVFVSNLSHLALVWPAIRTTLHAHPIVWAIFQGILPPTIISLFYYFLPVIFRRLATNAGDITKPSRERHVMRKLFSFYLLNQLFAFSLFSTLWGFGAVLIHVHRTGLGAWNVVVHSKLLEQLVQTLITESPYWCCWLLQRNLGAAVDLGQLVPLTWGALRRKYLARSNGPQRELVNPQPFNYAAQYSYYLFYAAVALVFGPLQPLALAITAIYFVLDSFMKRYMLVYVFITKHESDGMFWRSLFNRMLVSVFLGNLVTALLVVVHGPVGQNWGMLAALVPLPGLLTGFKWYCAATFDDAMQYYRMTGAVGDEKSANKTDHRGVRSKRTTRPSGRFQHPALTQSLATLDPVPRDLKAM